MKIIGQLFVVVAHKEPDADEAMAEQFDKLTRVCRKQERDADARRVRAKLRKDHEKLRAG